MSIPDWIGKKDKTYEKHRPVTLSDIVLVFITLD